MWADWEVVPASPSALRTDGAVACVWKPGRVGVISPAALAARAVAAAEMRELAAAVGIALIEVVAVPADGLALTRGMAVLTRGMAVLTRGMAVLTRGMAVLTRGMA